MGNGVKEGEGVFISAQPRHRDTGVAPEYGNVGTTKRGKAGTAIIAQTMTHHKNGYEANKTIVNVTLWVWGSIPSGFKGFLGIHTNWPHHMAAILKILPGSTGGSAPRTSRKVVVGDTP